MAYYRYSDGDRADGIAASAGQIAAFCSEFAAIFGKIRDIGRIAFNDIKAVFMEGGRGENKPLKIVLLGELG